MQKKKFLTYDYGKCIENHVGTAKNNTAIYLEFMGTNFDFKCIKKILLNGGVVVRKRVNLILN